MSDPQVPDLPEKAQHVYHQDTGVCVLCGADLQEAGFPCQARAFLTLPEGGDASISSQAPCGCYLSFSRFCSGFWMCDEHYHSADPKITREEQTAALALVSQAASQGRAHVPPGGKQRTAEVLAYIAHYLMQKSE